MDRVRTVWATFASPPACRTATLDLRRIRLNRHNGTAGIEARVGAPGRVRIQGTARVKGSVREPGRAGATPPGPWVLPATELSNEQEAGYPELAFAPDGSATAVWGSFDGVDATLQAATRPPGGTFGAPADLAGLVVEDPHLQLDIAPDGTAVAVWRDRYSTSPDLHNIQAVIRPPGTANFGPAIDLSPQDGSDAAFPQVESGPDGATVIWTLDDGADTTVQSATRPAGGSFGAPVEISAALGDAEEARLAVGPDGTAAVVWIRPMIDMEVIQAATRSPGETAWQPANLSQPINNFHAMRPRAAVGPDGTVTAVWHLDDGMSVIVQAATLNPGAVLWNRVDLTQSGQHSAYPWVEFSPDGTTTAVWIRHDFGSGMTVQSATRPPGGSFGPPVSIYHTAGATDEPRLAVGPDGTTAVAWAVSDGGTDSAWAATRASGSSPWITEALQEGGDEVQMSPQVVLTSDGSAAALWASNDSTTQAFRAATRPAGGSFGAPVELAGIDPPPQTDRLPEIAASPDGTGIVTAFWWGQDDGQNVVQTASTTAPELSVTVGKAGNGRGTVAASGAGIDCGTSCTTSLPAYTEVTLTATAAPGSAFTGWSGACSGSGTTCELRMDDAMSVTATFEDTTGPSGPTGPTGSTDPTGPPAGPDLPGVTGTTAVFDGRRLHVRLKCDRKFKPRCAMTAVPVTGKDRKAKRVRGGRTIVKVVKGTPMAKPLRRTVRAGKWVRVTFLIKPQYRAKIAAMATKSAKQLYVRQKVRSKKIGKKPQVIYHRYRVRSSGR